MIVIRESRSIEIAHSRWAGARAAGIGLRIGRVTDLLSDPPSPLDAAIGVVADELLADAVVLRLDPPVAALGGDEPRPFLHGGTLAACVDTARLIRPRACQSGRLDRRRPPLRLPLPGPTSWCRPGWRVLQRPGVRGLAPALGLLLLRSG